MIKKVLPILFLILSFFSLCFSSGRVYSWLELSKVKINDSYRYDIDNFNYPICRFPGLSNSFFEIKGKKKTDVILMIEIKPDSTIGELINIGSDNLLIDQLVTDMKKWIFYPASDSSFTSIESWSIFYLDEFLEFYYNNPDVDFTEITFDYDKGPVLIKNKFPRYPEIMRNNKLEGLLIVDFFINSEGKVGDVFIQQSVHEIFDKCCVDAVMKWELEPAIKDSQSVSVWETTRFNSEISEVYIEN